MRTKLNMLALCAAMLFFLMGCASSEKNSDVEDAPVTKKIPIHKLSFGFKPTVEIPDGMSRLLIVQNLEIINDLEDSPSSGYRASQLFKGDSVGKYGYAIFDVTNSADNFQYLGYLPNSGSSGPTILPFVAGLLAGEEAGVSLYRLQSLIWRHEHFDLDVFYTSAALDLILPAGDRTIAYTFVKPDDLNPIIKDLDSSIQDAFKINLVAGETYYVLLQKRKKARAPREFIELKGYRERNIERCGRSITQTMDYDPGNHLQFGSFLFVSMQSNGASDRVAVWMCYLLSGIAISTPAPATEKWIHDNSKLISEYLGRRLALGVTNRRYSITSPQSAK